MLFETIAIIQDTLPPMAFVPYALTRPFLFGLDPEDAHDLTLGTLARIQRSPLDCAIAQPRVADPVTLAGLAFPNRIGLAAGLDKNGRCIDGLGAMGFGFIEVGTVTPKAQPGNPKPRMFRLPEAQALINRLGFNNDGLDTFIANVVRARFRQRGGILGLNIGKNASTPIERAADDYLACLDGVYPHADYVTVNISSPNTQEPARAAERRRTRRAAGRGPGTPGANSRGCMAVRCRSSSRSHPTWTTARSSCIAAHLAPARHRRRDRHQHHHRARSGRAPAAWRVRPAACQARRCSRRPTA